MSVAIIPARGGSKRIPGKNIKSLAGEPVLHWVIKAAQQSIVISRVIVSTDDEEIARIALEAGAEVPFLRSSELADDQTPMPDVVRDTLMRLDLINNEDIVCMLFPTAGMLYHSTILKDAFEIFCKKQPIAEFLVGLGEFPFPIERGVSMDKNSRVTFLDPGRRHTRSQDLGKVYYDAAQFIYGKVETWLNRSSVWGDQTYGLVLPRTHSIDVDELADFRFLEIVFKHFQSNSPNTGGADTE